MRISRFDETNYFSFGRDLDSSVLRTPTAALPHRFDDLGIVVTVHHPGPKQKTMRLRTRS